LQYVPFGRILSAVKPVIEYLPDDSIDDAMDLELRGLLSTCFKKPQDYVFKDRRYFRIPYPHRWVIRDENGQFVSHIGVHDMEALCDEGNFRFGGICEVCVHPDYRGRGHVRAMLKHIHAWLLEHGFAFSILFGHPGIYSSSGYIEAPNLLLQDEAGAWQPVKGMICELGDQHWPAGSVRLPGGKF